MAIPGLPRSSGVLLHPTSLPGPFGIGDLGPEAYRWVDLLADAKQTWWQILPLGPTGFGDSPYQAYSAFAGNVLLLSPEWLQRVGLVQDCNPSGRSFRSDQVDYEAVTQHKRELLHEAWQRFQAGHSFLHDEFRNYQDRERGWLPDYALFMATREHLNEKPLAQWPIPLRQRSPKHLAGMRTSLASQIGFHEFGQFLFDKQWTELRKYAAKRGVKIIGDAPIFVSGDSADVWANAGEFLLEESGEPKVVAGVPPDYFSEDGQHWGNPLYNWDAMQRNRYAWWVARLRRQFEQVDLVRLDHFRGFEAAWHIPASEKTAKNGHWVPGPGAALFHELKQQLSTLPIIAEDLGLITKEVHALREEFQLPGMRVLQFMLGGPDNPYWPHNYDPNTVAYTGTHDNDTTNGWFATLKDEDIRKLQDYSGTSFREPNWDLLRMAWGSVATLAIAPLQDVIGMGTEARMNTPGVAEGNWRWRVLREQISNESFKRLRHMTELYGRVVPSSGEPKV